MRVPVARGGRRRAGRGALFREGGRSASAAIYCNWLGKNEGLFPKGISLTAGIDNAKARYNGYASLLSKKKPVAGIGVAAVTDGNVILAHNNKAVVQIGATYVNSGITLAQVKVLAKKALLRASATA